MENKQLKEKITKLLMDTITERELIELRKLLNKPTNRNALESYIRSYHDLNLALLKNNVEKAYTKVVNDIDKRNRPVKRLIPNWMKYAASIVLLVGFGYVFQDFLSSMGEKERIEPKMESITLEMENGTTREIDITKTKKVLDENGALLGTQNNNRLRYSVSLEQGKNLVYNTLHIPNGKRFEVELSDGTLVYLNSASSLRYPVNFSASETRKVYLSGEGYFDVAKDSSRQFIVSVDNLDVKVLVLDLMFLLTKTKQILMLY